MIVLLILMVIVMRFKKVYIEITNGCNLNCDFCIGNKRKVKFMTFSEFKIILSKIKPYTNYLYFHVLGEPLLHPDVVKFIKYAHDSGFNINITTNGYLIDKLKGIDFIRQINVSIHSFNSKYGVSFNDYINNVFDVIDSMSNTYISLRLWVGENKNNLNTILEHYGISNIPGNFDGFKLRDKVYLSKFHEFIWPSFNNNYYSEEGSCYGLIDHIGILSDGSIVPCCLDSNGSIFLGNIFSDSLDDILSSDRVKKIIDGFKGHYKCEEFCRHCKFLDK